MPDAKQIAAGRDIAYRLTQAQAQGTSVANQERAKLSVGDVAALSAFRDHQLQALVSEIEDSDVGAAIRWEAAKAAYADNVTKALAASLKG